MATPSPTGLPIPTLGDSSSIATTVGPIIAALDLVTVPLFSTTGNRDTAYAAKAFGLCVVGASVDAGTLYRRRGGAWREVRDSEQAPAIALTSASGSISSGAFAEITFATTERSDGGISTPGGRIQIPASGWWDVSVSLQYNNNTTGHRIVSLYRNAAVDGRLTAGAATLSSGYSTYVQGSTALYLASGDAISIAAWQNSGGSLGWTAARITAALRRPA